MTRIDDLEAAELSKHVYNPDHNHLHKGWERVIIPNCPIPFEDESTGFLSQLYRKELSPGEYHYVLAFAGTNEGIDWATNLQQAATGKGPQYEQAKALSEVLHRNYGDKLSFTGHSLGGGLATYASMNTGRPATVFNPAAVSRKNPNYSYIPEGQVKTFIHEGDPLDFVQNIGYIPSQGDKVIIGQNTEDPLENHNIDSIIRELTPIPLLTSKINNESPEKTPANNTPVLEVLQCSPAVLENTRDIKEDEPEDKIIVICSHDRPKLKRIMPFFELVPDKKTLTDSLEVKWNGPKKPASLTLIEDNSHKTSEGFTFKPKFLGETNVLIKSFMDLFVLLKDPTVYFLQGIPSGSLPVKVYSPVKNELKIELPVVPALKAGSKLVGNEFNDEGVFRDRQGRRGTHGTNPKNPPKAIESKSLPIQLKTDGLLVESDLIDLIAGIINFATKVYNVATLIKDNVPQVGWYIDFNVQWFQGEFILEWGKKEFEDYRAYNWYKATIDVSIIKAEIELGFGISGFTFEAQVFGKLTGEIKASLLFEIHSPESKKFPLALEGSIIGALGARVQVGYFLKVEASIDSGINIDSNVEFIIEKELKIDGQLTVKWTGIKAKLEGGVGKGDGVGSRGLSGDRTLMDEATLYEYNFFKAEKVENNDLRLNEIQNKLEDQFRKGINLRVVEEKKDWLWNETKHDLERLAGDVALQIDKRKELKKDSKTIEALAKSINQDLRKLSEIGWARDRMTKKDFDEYFKSAKFYEHLNGIVDPTKMLSPQTFV